MYDTKDKNKKKLHGSQIIVKYIRVKDVFKELTWKKSLIYNTVFERSHSKLFMFLGTPLCSQNIWSFLEIFVESKSVPENGLD